VRDCDILEISRPHRCEYEDNLVSCFAIWYRALIMEAVSTSETWSTFMRLHVPISQMADIYTVNYDFWLIEKKSLLYGQTG
jgi:hypothetical protein